MNVYVGVKLYPPQNAVMLLGVWGDEESVMVALNERAAMAMLGSGKGWPTERFHWRRVDGGPFIMRSEGSTYAAYTFEVQASGSIVFDTEYLSYMEIPDRRTGTTLLEMAEEVFGTTEK
jgi:hypothetical protein